MDSQGIFKNKDFIFDDKMLYRFGLRDSKSESLPNLAQNKFSLALALRM
jgi:hypothetical protein